MSSSKETKFETKNFFKCSLNDVEELVEMVLDSFIYADQLANHLEISKSKFKELYYEEIKRDITIGITNGVSGYIRINGEIAAFASLIDVADICISPLKDVVNDKLEAYERVMNSIFMMIKDSHPRKSALYFQYIVTKNKYANFTLASDLVNGGGRLALENGCKYLYAIPINKIAESFEKKWTHSIICEIDLDLIKFGDSYPFEGIDFKIPLIMYDIEKVRDKFQLNVEFKNPTL